MVATSDIDKEVVVSYAAIHCGLTTEMIENYPNYPTKEEMIKDLTEKRLGYDFAKDKEYNWNRLAKKKDKTKGIEKYWLADKLSKNLGDVSLVKELSECDLLTYSMPCTDLSISGERKGLDWTCMDCNHKYNPAEIQVENRYNCPNCCSGNIKSTRSGLLYEVERLLVQSQKDNTLPKYLIMENVDALVSKKFINSFNDWIGKLGTLGYNTYYQTINAKNAGVPQNRNRIFCISILKEIDTGKFTFPEPFDTGVRLKDLLEQDEQVLEKYFLSDEVQMRLKITDETLSKNVVGTTIGANNTRFGQRDIVYQQNGRIGALLRTDYIQPKQILSNELFHIADLKSERFLKMHEQSRRVYEENGVSPALHTCGGGNSEPKIMRNSPSTLRLVRKLTPKECHRLMGFADEDFDKCKAVGMSDTQGYKQAGNSIVVNVIELIIEHIYKAQYDEDYKCLDETTRSMQNSLSVAEIFAGVGGFRVGLNRVKRINESGQAIESGDWSFVWANQYEPSTKTQHAFDCYEKRFGKGSCSNEDINKVNKYSIPKHNLLVGGFPCQDYSVARTLANEQGIEGEKGVLFWSIRDILANQQTPFVLLENVDRLLKSPANMRGKNFAVILKTFNELGYGVQWRVINASDYGMPQKRKRLFIFAYKNNTKYAMGLGKDLNLINTNIFNTEFKVEDVKETKQINLNIYKDICDVSNCYKEGKFLNTGIMRNGVVMCADVVPLTEGSTTLGEILEKAKLKNIDLKPYIIAKDKVHRWQYLKGSKKMERTAKNGHTYIYSEGAVPFPDKEEEPARTILTSEGSVSRTSHIIYDKDLQEYRVLTPEECELLQMLPIGWTNTMPKNKRYFVMGNALVTGIVTRIEPMLREIIIKEQGV